MDAEVLAQLFGLKGFEHVALRSTLSGRPYIAIRVQAPKGVKGGSVVYGTVKANDNGSVFLAVKPV
jgi:hypothetical protein